MLTARFSVAEAQRDFAAVAHTVGFEPDFEPVEGWLEFIHNFGAAGSAKVWCTSLTPAPATELKTKIRSAQRLAGGLVAQDIGQRALP